MNFFDSGIVSVERMTNGGYAVGMRNEHGPETTAAFSNYEEFSQWLGEQAREYEQKRDSQFGATTGTVTWSASVGVPVSGGGTFEIEDCQCTLAPTTERSCGAPLSVSSAEWNRMLAISERRELFDYGLPEIETRPAGHLVSLHSQVAKADSDKSTKTWLFQSDGLRWVNVIEYRL